MKKYFILFLIFSLCGGTAVNAQSLKVMTYNVLAFKGYMGPEAAEDHSFPVIDVFCDSMLLHSPDIITFQEAPVEDSVKKIAQKLSMNYRYFKARWPGNQEYPIGFPGAILSKFPIIGHVDFNLKYPDADPVMFNRHYGMCELQTPSGIVAVYTLHLCADFGGKINDSIREREIDWMLGEIKARKAAYKNIFLMGDFNSIPSSTVYQKIIAAGFSDDYYELTQDHTFTAPTHRPVVRIDYIFSKGDFSGKAVKAEVTKAGRYSLTAGSGPSFSDHLPVIMFYK